MVPFKKCEPPGPLGKGVKIRERSQMTSSFFGQFACFSLFKVTPCQLWLTPPPSWLTSFVNAPLVFAHPRQHQQG